LPRMRMGTVMTLLGLALILGGMLTAAVGVVFMTDDPGPFSGRGFGVAYVLMGLGCVVFGVLYLVGGGTA